MYKKRDIIGNRYGKLTVIADLGHYKESDRHYYSLVKCDCGNEFPVLDSNLINGRCTQCRSCANSEHQKYKSKIYGIYSNMKRRCYDSKDKSFKNYGARGIKVCEEWLKNPSTFFEWAYKNGYEEKEYGECTLDRKNVNGDYCPENCRWVNEQIQANNRRNTIYMDYKGERMPLRDVARITGIKPITIYYRLKHGMSDEDAIKEIVRE